MVIGEDEYGMTEGECIGFKAGTGVAHQLVNRSTEIVTYLEIGDRTPNDDGDYPNDDITFYLSDEGTYVFTHKDGTPYGTRHKANQHGSLKASRKKKRATLLTPSYLRR